MSGVALVWVSDANDLDTPAAPYFYDSLYSSPSERRPNGRVAGFGRLVTIQRRLNYPTNQTRDLL